MHAVTGQAKKQHCFTLTAKVGNTIATILVDSGSTDTFMTPELANKAQCLLTPNKKVKVTVANGENLHSEFHAKDC
jgi:predicted aspartyl protease